MIKNNQFGKRREKWLWSTLMYTEKELMEIVSIAVTIGNLPNKI
jgi:hypothetical protein